MKLSPDARQHLFELTIAAGRPTDETPTLIKHGLAYVGKSRFGEYARATDKGYALAKTWAPAERTQRESDWLDKTVLRPLEESVHSTQGSRSGAGKLTVEGNSDAVSSFHRGSTTRKRRTVEKQAEGFGQPDTSQQPPRTPLSSGAPLKTRTPPRAVSTPAGSPSSRPRREASKASDNERRAGTSPNLVRVRVGNRYTYYPLTNYESIKHGEKVRVFSAARPFSTAAVGAPATDGDVLF